jgi:hypothetical protein
MKKLTLTIIAACLALSMAAQEQYKVKFQGAKPNIADFAETYLNQANDGEEDDCADESTNAFRNAWNTYRKGQKLASNQVLTVDVKNGFIVYESHQEGGFVLRVEMVYWNESDNRHKLIACGTYCYQNGTYQAGQFDGLTFLRYDSNTKTMQYTAAPGFDIQYTADDGAWVSYDLPRQGKDITVSYWYDMGKRKTQKTLKWNGKNFTF